MIACPSCKSTDSRVSETRGNERKRICRTCRVRFVTVEIVVRWKEGD